MGVELQVAVERESLQIVVRHLEIFCLRVFVMRGAWWKGLDWIEQNGIYNEIQMEC